MNRRKFLKHSMMSASVAALGQPLLGSSALSQYNGPNVVIVRFGGGVRRRETIVPDYTYAPYLLYKLVPQGTLYRNMEIDQLEGVETSHGQGTLYILSGKYDRFKDIGNKLLGQRFESKVPTLFEYLRKTYNIPEHQSLIINGEDRTDEEFYTFSNHHLFGAHFRSNVLSLYRYKTFLLRRQLEEGFYRDEKRLLAKQKELKELESLDYRTAGKDMQNEAIQSFWQRWREHFGESGFVNERGDRLLTQLSMRAIKELKPKLMMINYNDPDYVHWGYMSHYTRGISVIDQGLQQLVELTQHEEGYRNNTIFVIVPDCGRDSNPFASVPCQHHFNSRSAHEIWALLVGPGITRGAVIDRRVDQTSIAGTIGRLMKFKAEYAEKEILEEAFL